MNLSHSFYKCPNCEIISWMIVSDSNVNGTRVGARAARDESRLNVLILKWSGFNNIAYFPIFSPGDIRDESQIQVFASKIIKTIFLGAYWNSDDIRRAINVQIVSRLLSRPENWVINYIHFIFSFLLL